MDKLSDYDFSLNDEQIALRPISPRSDGKLLYYHAGEISDYHVGDYAALLDENDLLIFNDTKVLPARLDGRRLRQGAEGLSAAKISVTLLAPRSENEWSAMIKPMKKIREGEIIEFSEDFQAKYCGREGNLAILSFEGENWAKGLQSHGRMPLPPYIEGKRPADAQDFRDYQPYLARNPGAVASPTASLHFDEALMNRLAQKHIHHETVTLHVGAGTFLPVQADEISAHKMHAEYGEISKKTVQNILNHKAKGGRVIAVGTTVLRLLEAASIDGTLKPFYGETDIFIRPGFEFQTVDGLITNFHLPRSTLLMLVAAFTGYEEMRKIYDHAIANNYRFFSYGDSSFCRKNNKS